MFTTRRVFVPIAYIDKECNSSAMKSGCQVVSYIAQKLRRSENIRAKKVIHTSVLRQHALYIIGRVANACGTLSRRALSRVTQGREGISTEPAG